MSDVLFESLRLRRVLRGLRWTSVIDQRSPATAGVIRIRSHSVLAPVGESDGAVLAWGFDMKPGAFHTLFVRLTEDEANRVYAADPLSVGVLEPVRRRMVYPWAVLAVRCGRDLYAAPFRIPRRGTEAAFVEALDNAAATCPAYMLAHRRDVVPDAQVFAQRFSRDLVPA
ncbi:hypothetical protein SEA_MASK_92 [Mycobacterium phage Mask]|nr:hypothetical protein SEA_SEJANUS_94 [Mycobacterium phage Sejanus]UVT31629.1 hypothetical protein SEA_MASK_92 [Mycobacterium phage Mask]